MHSRFGLVTAVKTFKDVKQGEEFLVHYGYPLQENSARWYKKMFEEYKKKSPGGSLVQPNFNTGIDNISKMLEDNGIDLEADFETTKTKRRQMKNLLGTTYWY